VQAKQLLHINKDISTHCGILCLFVCGGEAGGSRAGETGSPYVAQASVNLQSCLSLLSAGIIDMDYQAHL
jgi:hypothetical protein